MQRSGLKLEFEAPGAPKIKSNGKIYLTTVRICFVPEVAAPGFSALDLPLQGLHEVR